MPRATATAAQRTFAFGLASGLTQSAAYKLAHPKQRMKPLSLATAAQRQAKQPGVQDELRRLMADPILWLACPEAKDPTIIRAHGVAVMSKLARSTDESIAMHAADWLARYADQLEAQQAAAKARPHEEKQRLLADLRGLYQKALAAPPTAERAPLVETVLEAEPVAATLATPVATPEERERS